MFFAENSQERLGNVKQRNREKIALVHPLGWERPLTQLFNFSPRDLVADYFLGIIDQLDRDLSVSVMPDNAAENGGEQQSLVAFVELVPISGDRAHFVRITGIGLTKDCADQLLDLVTMDADAYAGWATA